jgi:hypothetical protein
VISAAPTKLAPLVASVSGSDVRLVVLSSENFGINASQGVSPVTLVQTLRVGVCETPKDVVCVLFSKETDSLQDIVTVKVTLGVDDVVSDGVFVSDELRVCDDVRELVRARDFVPGLVVDMVGMEREHERDDAMVCESVNERLGDCLSEIVALSDGDGLLTMELVVVWDVLACVEALSVGDTVDVIGNVNTLLLADSVFVALVGAEALLLVDSVALWGGSLIVSLTDAVTVSVKNNLQFQGQRFPPVHAVKCVPPPTFVLHRFMVAVELYPAGTEPFKQLTLSCSVVSDVMLDHEGGRVPRSRLFARYSSLTAENDENDDGSVPVS